ncbi:MAG: DUF2189 domain-containing protein [Alphaproteobacteria bacterium]|nr:DUF2189 domain-containing protein [Alphaproteobacteria bacterium]
MAETIRNPIEWGVDQLRHAAHGAAAAGRKVRHVEERLHAPQPAVRRIAVADLWDALVRGAEDFGVVRSDVVFLCAFYPLAGLLLWKVVYGAGMVHMLFPLVAGFALLGPLAAVGLLEMSRVRERGEMATFATAFRVVHAPSFGAIVMLGILLLAIFLVWLGAAALIYRFTLGPALPVSLGSFLDAVFTTPQGWTMIVAGVGVGFLFAALVFVISVVSFALLLDRDTGLDTAVSTSIRVVRENPGPMAAWGVVTAGGLVIGSLPLLLGLVAVFPILGHATWHLYRKVVRR